MSGTVAHRPVKCLNCGRPLTDPDSVKRGIGPECWAKLGGSRLTAKAEDQRSSSDVLIPLDWETMDIVLKRRPNGLIETNVPHVHVHHSPSGFEWGYGGSGPSDLALNILALFLPKNPRQRGVSVFRGPRVSGDAFYLHQRFKAQVIATLDRGTDHTIKGDEVRAWLRLNGTQPRR